MILDSSAILGVILEEHDAEQLVDRLRSQASLGVGAATLAEAAIVLGTRIGFDKLAALTGFLQTFQVEIIPFSDLHWRAACSAYQLYGKGRHPASLNFGDCLSYATAKLAGQSLFYVGNDFVKTDLG